MWDKSLVIGYSKLKSEKYITSKIHNISDSYNILFANFHNSVIGVGGVGTVTRSMQKYIPNLHMVCYDPLIKKNTVYGDSIVYPVSLDLQTVSGFQIKYAKQYLWPLLHDITSPLSKSQVSLYRRSYLTASLKFANTISQVKVNNSKPWIYWINDYSLAGTIGFLRKNNPEAKICFSLRSPFGYSQYPDFYSDDAILLVKSIIQADFISFHRTKDLINFMLLAERLGSLTNYIKVDWTNHVIRYGDHSAVPRVVPLGNDPSYRLSLAKTKEVELLKNKFFALANGCKIISSISRFEIHKGIKEELDSIETLLRLFPKCREEFVFIRVAYLAKEYLKIPAYHDLYMYVRQKVVFINKKYGTDKWKPIIGLFDKKFTDYEVTGLLRSTDILLVMSLADGFNHSSVEGVLSKLSKDHPLLLLSSDVGSSDYLGQAPIRINPKDSVDTAIKIFNALRNNLSDTKNRQNNLSTMAKRLSSSNWTHTILDSVININKNLY